MIISSGLSADVSDLSLELLVDRYDNLLRDTMDTLAPVKSRTIVLRPNFPWYKEDIGNEKRKRRRLEPGRWRCSHFFTTKIERIREELVLRKSGLVHSPGLAKPTCLSRLSEFDLVTDEDVLKVI
ncbi:unnamed protein product [Porites lobata]|uniref:DUF362 domain-containing protein n=1 Tax=Porites lobata TaxID=104759 RepID=A0ABN8S4G6_9CNID|nr:unnamed protein product [Porites lobata]